MTAENPDLSVIIVSFNPGSFLQACLKAIPAAVGDASWEILLVDNGSTDGSVAGALAAMPAVRLIEAGSNRGFAAANNLALRAARGRTVCLLNPDTQPPAGTIGRLLDFLDRHAQAGVVGPVLLWPDGTPQPFSYGGDPTPLYLLRRAIARIRRRDLHAWSGGIARPVDWVSGACLITRREAITAVGGLDEQFFLYFEDNDWCRRMRQAGWSVWIDPWVQVIHHSRPNPTDLRRRGHYDASLRYFYHKHYGFLAAQALGFVLQCASWRSSGRAQEQAV